MRRTFIAFVLAVACPFLTAQQSLNNDAVIKLVKAGLSDDLIVSTINSEPGSYDTSVDGIIALKAAGLSDKVVASIVAKAATSATAVLVPTAVPASPSASAPTAQATPFPTNVPTPAVQPPSQPAPSAPLFHSTDGKVRVYITDHPMFEANGMVRASGDRNGASAAGVSHTQAGDDPRTVEVEADIMKVCPSYIVASNNPDRSDLVLVFRRRGGARSSMFAFGGLTGLALAGSMKVDGASLFQADGDMLYATKQNTVEKSIRDICSHIPVPTPK
jgi:hypothetical protein